MFIIEIKIRSEMPNTFQSGFLINYPKINYLQHLLPFTTEIENISTTTKHTIGTRYEIMMFGASEMAP